MILVFSAPGDAHATAVLSLLEARGEPAFLLDFSDFPQRCRLLVHQREAGAELRLVYDDGRVLPLDAVRVAWWRRPQAFSIDARIGRHEHQGFAYAECEEAWAGVRQCLRARWVNPPLWDEAASHKIHQLDVARGLGLAIPETLVTNDAEEARAFVERLGPSRVICKAFSATIAEWRETRLVGELERQRLGNVRYCPVIFQEYVPPGVDLRITVVGKRVFAAAIDVGRTAYPVDFRMDMARAAVTPANLPGDVEAKLLALMDRLHLEYGAIDVRRDPDGRHWFLEVNPSGQWLFVEERTGQPITEALAGLLASHAH